jgi:hypothetical protein
MKSETEILDAIRSLDRDVAELRSELSFVPLREAKVVAQGPVTVYEFWACSDSSRRLYLDNEEIADHLPGGSMDDKFVASIDIDGTTECWLLVGVAEKCKTGGCAEIVGWGPTCDSCEGCYNLTPCGGGSPIVVRGSAWARFSGKAIRIPVASVEGCYTVTPAAECASVNEDLSPDDVLEYFTDCSGCGGCYELTPCEGGSPRWVKNNLAQKLGGVDPSAVMGTVWAYEGVCYEATDFEEDCTHEEAETLAWADNGFYEAPSGLRPELGCNSCCYLLTPCPDQEGADPIEVRPAAGDPDLWTFVEHAPVEDGEAFYYPSNGRVIRLADHFCYTVTKQSTCTDPVLGLGTVEAVYDPPDSAEEPCFACRLTTWQKCGTTDKIVTYSDLSEFNVAAAGSPFDADRILKRAEDEFCYEFYGDGDLAGGGAVAFTVEADYPTCGACEDPRFKLSPSCGDGCGGAGCDGGSDTSGGEAIVISQADAPDLINSIGRYVKIEGKCYYVDWTEDETTTDSVSVCGGPFASCSACKDAKAVITVVAKRGDDFIGLRLSGNFTVCGEEPVTDECEEAVTAPAYEEITEDFTASSTSKAIFADATAAPITVLLPPAASNPGQQLTVKKVDASANAVTIDGDGTETIDGSLTQGLAAQFDGYVIKSNGTTWFIIGAF